MYIILYMPIQPRRVPIHWFVSYSCTRSIEQYYFCLVNSHMEIWEFSNIVSYYTSQFTFFLIIWAYSKKNFAMWTFQTKKNYHVNIICTLKCVHTWSNPVVQLTPRIEISTPTLYEAQTTNNISATYSEYKSTDVRLFSIFHISLELLSGRSPTGVNDSVKLRLCLWPVASNQSTEC